jgi:glycosyltransferase involved in cell wall biosynthesis
MGKLRSELEHGKRMREGQLRAATKPGRAPFPERQIGSEDTFARGRLLRVAKPQIGVVVPTLNAAATLEWTLCSLRSQRGVGVEIVVVDSGSTDGTLDICKNWGVRTIYVPPGNIYRAINAGMCQMGTEWVASVDSDDLVYPHSYARLIALGECEQASLVYGDDDCIDFEGRYLFTHKRAKPGRVLGILKCGAGGFLGQAAVWRRSAFEELGGFDERYRLIADHDFYFRLISSGYRVARLAPPTVAATRRHPGELSIREAATRPEEIRLFRSSRKIRKSPKSLFDLLALHLLNSPTHLWRLRSKRTWHRSLLKLVGEWPH